MIRSVAFVLVAWLLLVAGSQRADAAAHDWLVLSDVHFDPFPNARVADRLADAPANRWRSILSAEAGAPFSNYGSDTNFALLESSLDAMRNEITDPPVVMITGDFLAHGFRDKFNRSVRNHDDARYVSFVDNAMRFLAMEFQAAFPHARLLPVIGNDDNACEDYQITPGSPFIASFGAAWGASVGASDPNAFVTQFAAGGYYTVPLPAGDAQAVVLNDVFWSTQYRNACGSKTADPGGDELTWFSNTMRALGSKKVWVLAHIPPGVDVYSTLHAPAGAPVMFLSPRFNEAMINATLGGPARVMTMVAGHTHMNGYRILGPDASRPYVPVVMMPSISPIYFNNPSFALLRVNDADASVEDEQVFVLDDLATLAKNGRQAAHWRREYDFDSVYGHGSMDAEHLARVQRSIFDDERVRRRFEQFYDGSSGRAPIADATWHAYWCANVALTQTQYQACASPQIQTQLPPHPAAPPAPTPAPTASP